MQAILLCGGKGERLRPLTQVLPKPLVPIKGRPIVDYIVNHLKKFGINKIIVTAGYQAHKLVEHFSNMSLATVVDSGDVDIIQRIKDCKKLISEDFLLLYGDTLSDVDLNSLINFHRANKQMVTVTAWPLKSQFGIMDLNRDGLVTEFKEKPILDKWINIGHFYFKKESLQLMESFATFEEFLHHLVNVGELNAYKHTGIHITVNTLKELSEAEENIDQMNGTPGELWQEVTGLEKEFLSQESTVLSAETSPKL